MSQPLFYVVAYSPHTGVVIPSYYSGLSVFPKRALALRRIRTLRRRWSQYKFRILPWHTEMGEVNKAEMWASALEAK